jgi:hypothetical protein
MASFRTLSLSRFALAFSASVCLASVLTGCGTGALDTSSTGTLGIQGHVFGGQQPVTGASIFLYVAGTGGNGSAATSILQGAVTTGEGGTFNIGTNYSCPSGTDQTYIVAVNGNPGLGTGNNNALILMAALGDCSNLSSFSFVNINEVTTAAAAWALAPFTTSYTNVGSSSTNTKGIQNAFLDAQLLADSSTGLPPTTLPANLTIETSKLYTLANAIASCVNSDGGSSCSPLFTAATPSGGVAPTDTLGAALNIVKHPAQNVAAVFTAASSQPPFPSLPKAPNDWTMTMTITGGGLSNPDPIDIDSNGFVWAGNHNDSTGQPNTSSISEFSPQGTPLSPSTGYGFGLLDEVLGLTIDSSDNVWVTNEETKGALNGSLTGFSGASSSTPGTPIVNSASGVPYFLDPNSTTGTYFPVSLSTNASDQIFVLNQNTNHESVFNPTTGAFAPLAVNNVNFPVAIAADASGGLWIANACVSGCSATGGPPNGAGDSTVTHVAADGTAMRPVCCFTPSSLATDGLGNAWIADGGNNSVSEINPAGTVVVNQLQVGGLQNPALLSSLSIDAGENLWIANLRSITPNRQGTLSGIASTTLTSISPNTSGCTTTQDGNTTCTVPGGFGLDINLQAPSATVPDRSGNVWVSSSNSNSLVMFFGLAVPTATPIRPTPTAP